MPILPVGRYKATVVSAGVDQLGPNKLAAITLVFEGYQHKDGNDYVDTDPGYTIISDQYLEKKDGSGIIEQKIRTLSNVFDWDGDFTKVGEFVGKRCKITVSESVYNNKTRHEVSWINHIDDGDGGAGGKDFDVDKAKDMQRTLGSKVRAILGSNTARTPAPVAPALPPSASTPPRATTKPSATAESVWAIVEAGLIAGKIGKDDHGRAWDTFLRENGQDSTDSVSDWDALVEKAKAFEYVPF
jgi:hypothetical protein